MVIKEDHEPAGLLSAPPEQPTTQQTLNKIPILPLHARELIERLSAEVLPIRAPEQLL